MAIMKALTDISPGAVKAIAGTAGGFLGGKAATLDDEDKNFSLLGAGIGAGAGLALSSGIGRGVLGVAGAIGGKVGVIAGNAAEAVSSEMGKVLTRGNVSNPLYRGGNATAGLLGNMFKYQEGGMKINKKGNLVEQRGKLKVKPLGMAMAAGVASPIFAMNALESVHESRAGTPSGTRRATPSYLDNAGADGDLVFAMHKNRRG